MRCRRVRRIVLEESGGTPVSVQEHLETCAQCAAYARDWARLEAGLARMADDPAPEPSVGFASRLVRGLRDATVESRLREASLIRTGRRFVLAALLATMLLLLGLLIPASGPVRFHSEEVLETAQPEAMAAQNYPLFSTQAADSDFEFTAASGGH